MKRAWGILVLLVLATAGWLMAQVPAPALAPLTEKEVIGLLKSKQPPAQWLPFEQRGVDFEIARKSRRSSARPRRTTSSFRLSGMRGLRAGRHALPTRTLLA